MGVSEHVGTLPAYGIRWDTDSDAYQCVRVLDNRLVPVNLFSPIIQGRMRRCVLSSSGAVSYYLHSGNSSLKADGTDADLSGGDGQVMVEVPRFHYLISTVGDYKYFLVGLIPFSVVLNGVRVFSQGHPWFQEGRTVPASHKYYGAFEGVLYRGETNVDGTGAQTYAAGDLIRSVSGAIPLTYFTRAERRTASADGVFHQLGYRALQALILLWFLEYASWNSQTALPGYTAGGTFAMAKVCKAGITSVLGNASGSVLWENANAALRCSTDQTGVVVANSYRGIENFYGHLWELIDGINILYAGAPLDSARIYLSNDPATWGDDTSTDYTDTAVDFALASGWARNLVDGGLFVNNVTGGSSSTFLCDYFSASSAAGWRIFRNGGNLADGTNAGLMSQNVALASTARYASLGGRVAA